MIATLLESSKEELELADVVSKLQLVEQKTKQQNQNMTERALVARHRDTSISEKVCWNCGRKGHVSKACLNKQHGDQATAAASRHLAASCNIAN
ncbi:hypothetical protein WJX74_009359 [Apatococcus lobatus]|uniref:CCHC-type domain-containing protein n=1 Tax=Apatococcus lobatus TaxID=904363 RepID=A0AAW1RCB0_9CHLO